MMESESKFGRIQHSSWADEVEEEEAQHPLPQNPKPNPFGSARPREIILQEKGIDWRLLDLHLQQKSITSRNGDSSKENNPINNRVSKWKLKHENMRFNTSAVSPIDAPPLRYPPRNMIATESIVFCSMYGLNVGQQNFQHKCNSKTKKKKAIYRNEAKDVPRSHNLCSESHIHSQRNQQYVSIEQIGQIKKNNCKADYGQSLGKERNFRRSATHNNWHQNMGSLLGKPPPVQGCEPIDQ